MFSKHMLIGTVLKPQGIKGQVKIQPENVGADFFCTVDHVLLKEKDGSFQTCACEQAQVRNDSVYANLAHAQTRNDAESQRGWQLFMDREHLEVLPENENYVVDLIGCEAVTLDGKKLGILKDVLQYSSTDVYVFSTSKGEMMVPALQFVIPRVDTENNIIYVDEKRLDEVAVFEKEESDSE